VVAGSDAPTAAPPANHPWLRRGWLVALVLVAIATSGAAPALPHVPQRDDEVLATLPRGVGHSSVELRAQAAARLDVALPLAQFYIAAARATGDLRFLGYADALLAHWRDRTPPIPAVLVLEATVLQSRHSFAAALTELDRALGAQPDDLQAWLTRATVLRVLGRYEEARSSCEHLAGADPVLAELCTQSLRALDGHLSSAFAAVRALPVAAIPNAARAWRCSELGEMAARLGDSQSAASWFRAALQLAPDDVYTRAAYADLLLEGGQAAETLRLLEGYQSMEPLLLRITIAQEQLGDPRSARSRALLASAFAVEQQRGDGVHRREQARFLLDVAHEAAAALSAARENWRTQREPADALILLRAAQAAGQPGAAAPAVEFVSQHGLEDIRLAPYLEQAPHPEQASQPDQVPPREQRPPREAR
jgi:tetratricopeptide (TPR) repeat protein